MALNGNYYMKLMIIVNNKFLYPVIYDHILIKPDIFVDCTIIYMNICQFFEFNRKIYKLAIFTSS
jgi:hypothetical protein